MCVWCVSGYGGVCGVCLGMVVCVVCVWVWWCVWCVCGYGCVCMLNWNNSATYKASTCTWRANTATPFLFPPPTTHPPPPHRYIDIAEEPDNSNRSIQFTIFDGNFSGSDSIVLPISTIDDNPTRVRNHDVTEVTVPAV